MERAVNLEGDGAAQAGALVHCGQGFFGGGCVLVDGLPEGCLPVAGAGAFPRCAFAAPKLLSLPLSPP
ncbi:MAG TPA: hypothetical protein VGG69_01955, partial [Rhizomicrobium sp.]